MSAPRVARSQQPDEAAPPDDATALPAARKFSCDMCGETFEGRPDGSGLFLWTRGDELRIEEPPLCERCAEKITVGALVKWAWEDEAEE